MSVSRCGLVLGMALGLLATGPALAQSPPSKLWNSFSVATWRSADGKAHWAVGYSGNRPTEQEARTSAVSACASRGGVGCDTKGAWNFGCVYITTGRRKNGATYGSSDSVEAALKKCREGGYTCKQPIGGCVDQPDTGPLSQAN